MTEVEKLTRQLGKAMQADARYLAYRTAMAENDADADLQSNISAFQQKKLMYERETQKPESLRNSEKTDRLEREIQELYLQIVQNPHMQTYEAAGQAWNEMLREIDAIISCCAKGEDPDTCSPEISSCGGNCTSCGGCG